MTGLQQQTGAAERLARAVRTGLPSAVRDALDCCHDGVVLTCVNGTYTGTSEVAHRLSGEWPLLPVLARGVWSKAVPDGDWSVITAQFPGLGASPADYTLRVRCVDGLIAEAVESYSPMNVVASDEVPLDVVSAVNRALFDAKPVVLAYIDADGLPSVSLRGSFQIAADMSGWMWARKASGGLVDALAERPDVSVLYRDSSTRTTLRLRGVGRVVFDDPERVAIFRATPEVEQLHDPHMSGAAIALDIISIVGTSPIGSLRIGS